LLLLFGKKAIWISYSRVTSVVSPLNVRQGFCRCQWSTICVFSMSLSQTTLLILWPPCVLEYKRGVSPNSKPRRQHAAASAARRTCTAAFQFRHGSESGSRFEFGHGVAIDGCIIGPCHRMFTHIYRILNIN